MDVADARGAGGDALRGVLLELNQIEVVAAILCRGGFGERSSRAGEHGQSRREGKGLLRSGEQHIDAQGVELDLDCAHRTDGVDDEHHVRILGLERRHFGQRAHDASRRLVVNERERIGRSGRQFAVDVLGADGRAPGDLQGLGLLAAAFRDVVPLVGKGAAHAIEHLLVHQVANSSLHHPPRGGRAQEDRLPRVEQFLEPRLDARVQVFEALAAMSDHVLT